MKKNYYLWSVLVLITSLTNIGCHKDSPFSNADKSHGLQINSDLKIQAVSDSKNLLSIVNLKNEASRKLGFVNFLTAGEKVNLLRLRFENLITEMDMNEKQLAFINDLNIFLVEGLFEAKSSIRSSFLKADAEIRKNAIKLFGEKEAIFLLTTLKTYDEFKSGIPNKTTRSFSLSSLGSESTGGEEKTCACNQSSDWCGDRDGPCISANCQSTPESGCGTLWAYPCNGWCKLLLPLL